MNNEIISGLLLKGVKGLGLVSVKNFLDRGFSLSEIWTQYRSQVQNLEALNSWVKQEILLSEKLGVSLIPLTDSFYPSLLREIADPPIILYVKGKSLSRQKLLGIVGTRKMTVYGRQIVQDLVRDLVFSGVGTVSGLAWGVDSFVHRETLKESGLTVAVLGSGLDIIYPAGNADLYHSIEEKGTLISEFPFGFRPTKYSFPLRNRIISGLCQGLVVIEAPRKSGSLITADLALSQNREVFAVPGSIYSPNSKGVHWLIKQGAILFESAEDIFESLNWGSDSLTSRSKIKVSFAGEELELAQVFDTKPCSIDFLSRNCHLPISKISAILTKWQLEDWVEEMPSGKFLFRCEIDELR